MKVTLRWKTYSSGKVGAYLDYYESGKRKREFLKINIEKGDSTQDKKEKRLLADRIRIKRELSVMNMEFDIETTTDKQKIDFIEYYENYVLSYTKKDINKIKGSFKKFKQYYKKKKLLIKNIDQKFCMKYMDYLLGDESGLSGDTPRNYWTRFKKVLKLAKIDKIIPSNPADDIRFKSSHSKKVLRKNVLSTEELQLIAKAECGNELVKRAFLFACFTGLGAAELRKLTWGEIKSNQLVTYRQKTKEQVVLDLHPVALSLMGERKPYDIIIFDGLPSDAAINKNIKYWMARAGVDKKITFYCGRHTFATQLLLNNVNLKTVADCMGHSSTEHTVKYLNHVNVLKTEAVNKLPSIEF